MDSHKKFFDIIVKLIERFNAVQTRVAMYENNSSDNKKTYDENKLAVDDALKRLAKELRSIKETYSLALAKLNADTLLKGNSLDSRLDELDKDFKQNLTDFDNVLQSMVEAAKDKFSSDVVRLKDVVKKEREKRKLLLSEQEKKLKDLSRRFDMYIGTVTASGIDVQVSGTKSGTTYKLNFIAGTNVTLTASPSSTALQRMDITIASTASGSSASGVACPSIALWDRLFLVMGA